MDIMNLRFLQFTLAVSCIHCLVMTSSTPTDDVIVSTPLGQIRGKRRTDDIKGVGLGSNKVDVFLGVPFAEPPVGDLRFEPPKPKSSWDGIRNATSPPPACPQKGNRTKNEDCLYLNVYSPFKAGDSSASYPVMVYIHGGSYLIGTANHYTGHVLARYGVVVVIINYRLGVFGFLSTGDGDLPGNYGIQDQILALKWVSQNIRAFRGDPKQVTIFGNSAGGASVGVLLISPYATGLFARAIIESGPIANTIWAYHHHATPAILRNYTMTVAERLNCTRQVFADTLKCMKGIKWTTLQDTKLPSLYETPESLMPVDDGKVIPGRVDNLLKAGKLNKVPVIIGMTEDECAGLLPVLVAPQLRKVVDLNQGLNDKQFRQSLDYVLVTRYGMPNNSHFLNEALFEYTDHKRSPPVNKKISNRYQLIQLCTDIQITAPTMLLAKLLSDYMPSVYLYVYDHVVTTPKYKPYMAKTSFHQLELPFVFGGPYFRPTDFHFPTKITYTADDKTFSKFMMKYWTNFAKYGNPTPNGHMDGIDWSKYHSAESEYLFIGPVGFAMYKHYKAHRVAFWNDYVPITANVSTTVKPTRAAPKDVRTFKIELIAVCVICGLLCVVAVVLAVVLFKQRRKAQWKLNKMPTDTDLNLTIDSRVSVDKLNGNTRKSWSAVD